MNKQQLIAVLGIFTILAGSAGFLIILNPLDPSQVDKIGPDQVDNGQYEFTSYEWNHSTPEEQGFDSSTFDTLENFVINGYPGTKSILVIRNGYIIYEKYFSGSNFTAHHLYSVTKSITSMLIGIAIDKGFIESVDNKVLSFFPDKTFLNVDERKETMSIYHLLTMTHGLKWEEITIPYGNPENSFSQMFNRADWVQWVLDLPMTYDPGTQFEYSTGVSHVLSAIIEEASGMKTNKFAEKYLFNPLGINSSELKWLTDGVGTFEGGRGLFLKTLDMAKLGQLYLNNGSWNDKQIVSKEWVINSTKNHSPTPNDSYGYQWRIHPNGYSALGFRAQRIYNVPEYDLSFIMTADLDNVFAANVLVNNILIPGIIR